MGAHGSKNESVSRLFPPDSFAEANFVRTLGHAPMGGADIKECYLAANKCNRGDGKIASQSAKDSWHAAWAGLADQLLEQGKASLAAGNPFTARSALLRAANYYRTSSFPLFSTPMDPRVLHSVRGAYEAFGLAAPHFGMNSYTIPLRGGAGELSTCFVGRASAPPIGLARSPLLVLTSGYDSDIGESFFFSRTFLDMGFHLIIYDGPGQGKGPFLDGTKLRHDWEVVLSSVLDWALGTGGGFQLSDGLVCYGLSLGGHLTLRAALHETRPTAYVVDPAHPTLRNSVYDKIGPRAYTRTATPRELLAAEAH